MRNPVVIFSVDAYSATDSGNCGFNVPSEVASLLGLPNDSEIALTVKRTTGETLFHGVVKMTSGTEVTAVDACRLIQPKEDLRITASRPPTRA